ncbi:uncharacterized protein BDR25DRAFT_352741 [Lindgomyces ingoldianus]|uniref:Uncharacterized protein n=1 Tax=Lindgomyces ingoldianus TaxID=673940 RepID=A0ACB6R230_9PLEO|nr:uncharacterized protein BDR25DRAFT_352741 [Lindgomyces ingoldianus]KAF2473328.1 hypothetical protein BDR25DRAFT_352741 [Lindgomyces ingoldianus]
MLLDLSPSYKGRLNLGGPSSQEVEDPRDAFLTAVDDRYGDDITGGQFDFVNDLQEIQRKKNQKKASGKSPTKGQFSGRGKFSSESIRLTKQIDSKLMLIANRQLLAEGSTAHLEALPPTQESDFHGARTETYTVYNSEHCGFDWRKGLWWNMAIWVLHRNS